MEVSQEVLLEEYPIEFLKQSLKKLPFEYLKELWRNPAGEIPEGIPGKIKPVSAIIWTQTYGFNFAKDLNNRNITVSII